MKNVEELARLLEKVMSKDENGEPYVFSRDEVSTLLSLIAFVEKLKALKWFGKIILWTAIALGSLIVNWERIKGFFQ